MKKYKFFWIIMALIIVGAGAWYFDREIINKDVEVSTSINENLQESSLNKENEGDDGAKVEASESIVFLSGNDKKTIAKVDSDGKNSTIFTDADEEDKLEILSNLAAVPKEIVVFLGKGPVGKLQLIKLDGSGKKVTVKESFGKPTSLALSPDGATIAFTVFSNVEEDYGHNLYLLNKNGENLRKIFNAEEELKNASFNKQSSQIVVAKVGQSGKSEIIKIDVSNGKSESLYTTDETILSLSWNGEKILFSQTVSKDISKSEVFSFSEGDREKILSANSAIINPNISSDGQRISYLTVNYKEKIETTSGDIYSILSSGKENKKVAEGIQILGWLP